MRKPQAESLTDAQIDAVYDYFENRRAMPSAIWIRDNFTETMGRHVVSDETGARLVNYRA